MITLPGGWKMQQLRAEQPTTQFSEFCESILAEIGRDTDAAQYRAGLKPRLQLRVRPTRLPAVLAAHDIDRCDCDMEVLERLFEWFVDEAC